MTTGPYGSVAGPAGGPTASRGERSYEGLVTGEAVLLDLRPASFATRGLALLLDAVIGGAVLLGVFLFAGAVDFAVDAALSAAITLSLFVLVVVITPVTIETATRGRSIGKLAAGLRVVRDDGGPVRFRQALARAVVGVGEIWLMFGSVALIASLTNDRGKRVGDMLAGTYVIRERSAASGGGRAEMPPELAVWASGTDIARLPDRLALAVRQFLSRTEKLAPTSRVRLGTELAGDLSRYVAPAPPADTHPERFMAAVLAERRRRELARLTREAADRASRDAQRAAASPLAVVGTRLIGE